jgi:hypothetical protein
MQKSEVDRLTRKKLPVWMNNDRPKYSRSVQKLLTEAADRNIHAVCRSCWNGWTVFRKGVLWTIARADEILLDCVVDLKDAIYFIA